MEKKMLSKCQWMATNRIKTQPPFNSLFPVDEKTVGALTEHMKTAGYDQSQPIILWKEKLDISPNNAVIIDGHTRLMAAKKIGLSPVYIAKLSFVDEKAALQYAIHNQRDRRNITDADLLRCIEAVDKRKRQGERSDLASSVAKSSKSAQETAKIIGTSERKVEKARTILTHADNTTKQQILNGEKSIHRAYQETQEERQKKLLSEKGKEKQPAISAEFKEAFEVFFKEIKKAKDSKWRTTHKRVIETCINYAYNCVSHNLWNVPLSKNFDLDIN